MTARRKKRAEVPLARDETWWLHPVYRGKQALNLGTDAARFPHRWVRSDAPPVVVEAVVDEDQPHADLAKVLYRLNRCRPGPVEGFYVVVGVEPGRYVVGQLCADPGAPVQLFEDLVYPTEAAAREKAAQLKGRDIRSPRTGIA